MIAEEKLKFIHEHLEKNIERMEKEAEIAIKREDEDFKQLAYTLLHDKAVFKGLLDLINKL